MFPGFLCPRLPASCTLHPEPAEQSAKTFSIPAKRLARNSYVKAKKAVPKQDDP